MMLLVLRPNAAAAAAAPSGSLAAASLACRLLRRSLHLRPPRYSFSSREDQEGQDLHQVQAAIVASQWNRQTEWRMISTGADGVRTGFSWRGDLSGNSASAIGAHREFDGRIAGMQASIAASRGSSSNAGAARATFDQPLPSLLARLLCSALPFRRNPPQPLTFPPRAFVAAALSGESDHCIRLFRDIAGCASSLHLELCPYSRSPPLSLVLSCVVLVHSQGD